MRSNIDQEISEEYFTMRTKPMEQNKGQVSHMIAFEDKIQSDALICSNQFSQTWMILKMLKSSSYAGSGTNVEKKNISSKCGNLKTPEINDVCG